MERNDSGTKAKIIVHVDPELEELMPGFLQNRRNDILSIGKALQTGDLETIRILGHSMKGSGGGYGLDPVSDFGALLERAAKEGDTTKISEALGLLSDYIERVQVVYG